MADFGSTLAPGTYYYASRFQIQTGPYTYGGYNAGGGGFWDGTTNVSGVLTVNPYVVSSFPFTEGFENTAFPPAGWAVEDLNAGNTWIRSTSSPNTGLASARYSYNGTICGNDWLFSPALTLTAGKTYSITYYYKAQSATFPERMNVYLGSGKMQQEWIPCLQITPTLLILHMLQTLWCMLRHQPDSIISEYIAIV